MRFSFITPFVHFELVGQCSRSESQSTRHPTGKSLFGLTIATSTWRTASKSFLAANLICPLFHICHLFFNPFVLCGTLKSFLGST